MSHPEPYNRRSLLPRRVSSQAVNCRPPLEQPRTRRSMDQLYIEELAYHQDSATLFAELLDLENAILLDSARPFSVRGRYDIFAASPVHIQAQECDYLDGTRKPSQKAAYFEQLRETLNEFLPTINNDYHLPFIGGAMGYLGYNLGSVNKPPYSQHSTTTLGLPNAVMGVYSWAVVVDHRQKRTMLVAHPQTCKRDLNDIRSRLRSSTKTHRHHFCLESSFQPSIDKSGYEQAFNRIQDYILAGDCYQINLTQHFSTNYQGQPWAAYLHMREAAAAPFSAFMQYQNASILSMSPERLLHVSNLNRVTTSPIKGTVARGKTKKSDRELAIKLLDSTKDRAENLMIVDLLRNDLGKTCEPGSIQVDDLFELQTFETVHHLVSTISGQLSVDKDSIDVLEGCFPGGSITGAPKVRAMEIINELETARRSVYCGSMGYLSCDGQMDFNIAIRTMLCENETIHCWAGGGIVADSLCDSEYEECLTKVDKLMSALPSK